ncbi:protein-tyrosine phosphatase family protein [Ramlibacter rhizophilus]|uniref:Phosphatase n=1 Tax=Ramlibacter rhizophilus TaxID=1781167 RepID=A0A4Z0BFN8_9BURK|nr:tyrosine-protein phosphatase [Ramlibacter rhizophilus]TFY96944.1 phosphatase [Ramlibacter rhizophilus]
MLLRRVQLPDDVPGSLWLSAMPGRFEPWPQFAAEAQQAGVQHVACLAPRDELAALSPAYHAAVVSGDLPFRWVQLSMRNFGVPEDPQAFRAGVQALAGRLRAGESVLLHCAAGMGRTGSAAACVLKVLGLTTAQALAHVRAAGSNPQNAQQSGFVEWF